MCHLTPEGKEGAGFMRMNVDCPRAILEKALSLLACHVK
jgi:bifunctional pyridoxal-dependent enzyme with beta-cystathionase and maltose regulon repressor activities